MIDLKLMDYKEHIRLKREGNIRNIWDPIRKKWLVLQPEELVRQLLLQYLLKKMAYNANRVRMEKGLQVNALDKRCDLLVFDDRIRPWLLAECKAPHVPVGQEVFEQIAWYNTALEVPYLLVTNGIDTYCCAIDYEKRSYTFLQEIPEAPGRG